MEPGQKKALGKHFYLIFLLCLHTLSATAQILAPDTVCVEQELTVQLSSPVSGTSFTWSFCSGDGGKTPLGINHGNPSGYLNSPYYIHLVRNGLDCYSFITCTGDSSIVRYYHGHSFYNPPLETSQFANLFVLTRKLRGIQVVQETGNWYAFVVDGSTMYRLNFGTDLRTGIPTVGPDTPFPNVFGTSDLKMFKVVNTWFGFSTDSLGNSLSRLHFINGLTSPPQVTNLGNVAQFNGPTGISLVQEGGNWFLFVSNSGDNTLSRVDFGNAITNQPSGINLGNPGNLLNRNTGLTLSGDCQEVNGYILNQGPGSSELVQLIFPDGVTGPVTSATVPNTGTLSQPYGASNFIRVYDTLFFLATSQGNNSLSVLWFPPCDAASRPGDTVWNPAPYHYLYPGTFNINFTYTGLTQSVQESCKPITVIPALTVELGPDRQICAGTSTLLQPDSVYSQYLWNTGDTTPAITVGDSGTYRLHVTNRFGCEAEDSVRVTTVQSMTVTVDTSICQGQRYWAQHDWQTDPGTYYDSLQSAAGCDSIVTTHLAVKPLPAISLGHDTTLCPGVEIILHATSPGGTYEWQDGSADSTHPANEPGLYWVLVTVNGCTAGDSVTMFNCPSKLWFPNAFTPNGDGLNDFFKPRGISIGRFRMEIYDRWGTLLFSTDSFETGWDGRTGNAEAPAGVYTWKAVWESEEPGNDQFSDKGTVQLLR